MPASLRSLPARVHSRSAASAAATLLVLAGCAATPTAAPLRQDELVISTDRPGFADGAGIVPAGHHQLEAGNTWTLRRDQGMETQTIAVPQVLTRHGISEAVELRALWNGYLWSRTTGSGAGGTVEGATDLQLGAKFLLVRQDEVLPTLALGVSSGLGTGSAEVGNRELEPVFKLLAERDLGDGWGAFANLNLALPKPDNDRFAQFQGAVGVTRALDDATGVFVEYYVLAPNRRHEEGAHYTDFGITHRVTRRLQVDLSAGLGWNDEADDLFVAVGAALLF